MTTPAQTQSGQTSSATTASATTPAKTERRRRKVQVGRVISDKMQKTITVQIERLTKHARYSKFIRLRTRLHAHDEKREAKIGDLVEIMETRPLSKIKRWRLTRIIEKAPTV
jgi:small subunit ribosomal protein S17